MLDKGFHCRNDMFRLDGSKIGEGMPVEDRVGGELRVGLWICC